MDPSVINTLIVCGTVLVSICGVIVFIKYIADGSVDVAREKNKQKQSDLYEARWEKNQLKLKSGGS